MVAPETGVAAHGGSVSGAIDVSAWTGAWGTFPVPGQPDQVCDALHAVGVHRIHLASLSGVWGHNQHVGNDEVYAVADAREAVVPVPILDPSLPTWREELERAAGRGDVKQVRLLPAFAELELADPRVEAVASAIEAAGLALSVQVRMEDERRQHPRARVSDVPLDEVLALAERHPALAVIIGGASWSLILNAADRILGSGRVFAETAQMDGVDSLRLMVEAGLGERLLFGTHAPLFMPLAGIARVVTDLDDEQAAAILHGNAARLFG